jgi:hypothetical protein
MRLRLSLLIVFAAAASLVLSQWIFAAAAEEKEFETLDANNFSNPSSIDNQWLPLKPGTRLTWEGTSIDEGDKENHRVIFTVTDLTKVIGGVRTVVCWDQDYVDGDLAETEICFFAQDNNGTVWLMGEYPEEYEDGEFVAAPCWMHGSLDGRAGIAMLGDPKAGTPSYSNGWAPSVEFTDRAVVDQVNQKTTVPAGNYENVLVIDEFNNEEPGAHQLKYYAPGVGNVRVGWRGDPTDQENLELIKFEQLSAEELAKAREAALKLEQNAYEGSKEVYGPTPRAEKAGSSATGQ